MLLHNRRSHHTPSHLRVVPQSPLSQDTGLVHLPGKAGKEGVSSVNPNKG